MTTRPPQVVPLFVVFIFDAVHTVGRLACRHCWAEGVSVRCTRLGGLRRPPHCRVGGSMRRVRGHEPLAVAFVFGWRTAQLDAGARPPGGLRGGP